MEIQPNTTLTFRLKLNRAFQILFQWYQYCDRGVSMNSLGY